MKRTSHLRAGAALLLGVTACSRRNAMGPDLIRPSFVPEQVQAHRVLGSTAAQVRRVSLPLPRGMAAPLVWADRATQVQEVGFWPEREGRRQPRRVILTACGPAADTITLCRGPAVQGEFRGPRESVLVIDKRYESQMPWEVDELVLTGASGSIGLRVGLKLTHGCHWWQWVTTEVLDEGPVCRTIRAKGAIPIYFERHESPEARHAAVGENPYPWFHKHNHVRGEILARCYANGVIELYVRHINGRFFTDGGDVEGVVPVIAFRGQGGDWPSEPEAVTERKRWRWDGASLDTAAGADLVSEEHPGWAWRDGDLCIYQPYQGVEARAGEGARQQTGDSYLVRAEQRRIPRGMGRTVPLVASIGPAQPEVAVYLLSDWWYGLSEDLCERPLLPVRDAAWDTVQKAIGYYRDRHWRGCFDDGAVARHLNPASEPGWEGETPEAQLIAAYLTGETQDYELAIRSAYHVADVAVDKALCAVRMHSYAPPAQSLPMQRTMGMAAAYLETGDPYLLDTARSVSESAYWWDRQNWPRRSYGRDAAHIRSLVYLYRYLGDTHDLRRAREALHRLISRQLPDGSFADQGDTTGVHAVMNLIIKPWMGCVATEAMLDYLAWEDDPVIEAAAMNYCRWLLGCRVKGKDGWHWTYQISHAGQHTTYRFDGTPEPLDDRYWQVEYLARLMGWAALRTADPAFYQAWYEAYRQSAENPPLWDHGANKIVTNLPWQRQQLWGAVLTREGVVIHPRTDLAADLREVVVSTPGGQVRFKVDEARRPKR